MVRVGTEITSVFTRNTETLGKVRFSQLHKMGNTTHVSTICYLKCSVFNKKLQDMQKKCESTAHMLEKSREQRLSD